MKARKRMQKKSGKAKRMKLYEAYSEHLIKLINILDYNAIDKVVECFMEARKRGAMIFFAGNGGSAATASHFSEDLGTRFFRTMSLSDNIPYITALGNDFGYEKIFSGQLSRLFKRNDVLVAISASGNSPNIVEAVKLVNKKGGITVGFTGFDGGILKKICRYAIHVPTAKGAYGHAEDMHLIIEHIISSYFYSLIPKNKRK